MRRVAFFSSAASLVLFFGSWGVACGTSNSATKSGDAGSVPPTSDATIAQDGALEGGSLRDGNGNQDAADASAASDASDADVVEASGPVGIDKFGFPIPPTSPTTAVAANNFLNTIGINIPINVELDSGPFTTASVEEIAAMVHEIGVRWIRGSSRSKWTAQHLALSIQTGLKTSYMSDGLDENTVDTVDLPNARQLADAGLLLFLEGPNEPDNYGFKWDDADVPPHANASWVPLGRLQSYWYAAVKGDDTLAAYAVADLTHSGAEPDNVGLQWLTIPDVLPDDASVLMPSGTTYADYANLHNYIESPSAAANNFWTKETKDNLAWNAADPTKSFSNDAGIYAVAEPFRSDYIKTWTGHYLGYSEDAAPSVPRITTETGWESALGPDAGPDSGLGGAEESGKLMLNVFLDQFARGYSLTGWYQLFDNGGSFPNTYGLYANADVSSRKAGAIYLTNFTSILADDSSDFTPGTLDWSIPSQPETVHGLLLQKKNGHFFLCLTDEHWPPPMSPDSITVNLGADAGATYTVKLYEPTVSTDPQMTYSGDSVQFTMTDHPVVLEVFAAN